MSKPSITNCPNTFFRKVHSFNCIFSSLSCFACVQIRHNPLSGGYCGEVPPLPIPNREVKFTCADGTAMQCGRVGSRLLLSRASITKVVGAFLLIYINYICYKVFKNLKKCADNQRITCISRFFFVSLQTIRIRISSISILCLLISVKVSNGTEVSSLSFSHKLPPRNH